MKKKEANKLKVIERRMKRNQEEGRGKKNWKTRRDSYISNATPRYFIYISADFKKL